MKIEKGVLQELLQELLQVLGKVIMFIKIDTTKRKLPAAVSLSNTNGVSDLHCPTTQDRISAKRAI